MPPIMPIIRVKLEEPLEISYAEATQSDTLSGLSVFLDLMKPLVKSKEEAMFDYIVSALWRRALQAVHLKHRIAFLDAEVEDLKKFIFSRAEDLRSKIAQTISIESK